MTCPRCSRLVMYDYSEAYCFVHGTITVPVMTQEEAVRDRMPGHGPIRRKADPLFSARQRAKAGFGRL